MPCPKTDNILAFFNASAFSAFQNLRRGYKKKIKTEIIWMLLAKKLKTTNKKISQKDEFSRRTSSTFFELFVYM